MVALGKRILGLSAAKIRARLVDLPSDRLPTLEQVREFITARKLSLDNKLDDVCSDARDAPKPVSERKGTRRATERRSRAVGKGHSGDQVRTRPVTANSVVVLNHLATDTPAPSGALVNENALVNQLTMVPPKQAGNAAHSVELLREIAGPQEQARGVYSLDETAGPEPVTWASSQLEQPPPLPKTPARLRDQFRALVKQLTAVLAPRPTPRKRWREEIGGGFRKAALALLRSAARIPPLHFLDPAWEPFTWLRLWECNHPPTTDLHQEHGPPTFSDQSPHL
jgi:hypothetical protein